MLKKIKKTNKKLQLLKTKISKSRIYEFEVK